MKIVISNINKDISQNYLRERLEQFGHVKSLRIENKMAIAEMPFDIEAKLAIKSLDKSQFKGIVIGVYEVRLESTDRRICGRIGGRRSQDPKSYTSVFNR